MSNPQSRAGSDAEYDARRRPEAFGLHRGRRPGAHAFGVMQVTGALANLRHDARVETETKAALARSPSPSRLAGTARTATKGATVMNKILVLSLIALGLGCAAPAFAKDRNHQASDAYASSGQDTRARDAEVRRTGVPEPTYMAIQTRGLAESE
jgi:hypothetical protein